MILFCYFPYLINIISGKCNKSITTLKTFVGIGTVYIKVERVWKSNEGVCVILFLVTCPFSVHCESTLICREQRNRIDESG